MTIKLIGGIVKSLNGPGQYRRITDIKLKAILLKGLPCLHSLLNAYITTKLPFADNLTSVQPVKRFYLFQLL